VADALIVLRLVGFLVRDSWLDPLRHRFRLVALSRRALRHVAAQIVPEFTFVVCVDFGVVLAARDRHISKTAVNQKFAFVRVNMDQNSVDGLSLAAVAGDYVTVVGPNAEMRTTNRLEARVVAPLPIPAACAHPLP
jgi:hypothetical protein